MARAHPTRYVQTLDGFELVPSSVSEPVAETAPFASSFIPEEESHVQEEPAGEVRLEESPAVQEEGEVEEVTPKRSHKKQPAAQPGKE